jgi:hypothetical protein
VRKQGERLKEQVRAMAKAERLSKPVPISPPYRPAGTVPDYAEELLERAEKEKGLDSLPGVEAFQDYIDQQDPEKMRRINWAAKVERARFVVRDAWRALEQMQKDNRATDWETLPEEQEFIDDLRQVAKEANQRLRVQGKATVTVLGQLGTNSSDDVERAQ